MDNMGNYIYIINNDCIMISLWFDCEMFCQLLLPKSRMNTEAQMEQVLEVVTNDYYFSPCPKHMTLLKFSKMLLILLVLFNTEIYTVPWV